jgi:hypothetical protein
MPTTRRRYQITETDAVTRALDLAAARWPGEPRSRLIVRLLEEAAVAMQDAATAATAARRATIHNLAGRYPTAYQPGYLEDLREDWPA